MMRCFACDGTETNFDGPTGRYYCYTCMKAAMDALPKQGLTDDDLHVSLEELGLELIGEEENGSNSA